MFNNGCDEELLDGIVIGFNMNPAMKLALELTYDYWEKDYQSPKEYWLENTINDNTVMSIRNESDF